MPSESYSRKLPIKIELTYLTLLPPSPYRLIIGQNEVDLINLEDEFDTINSQLPKNLVAPSLYLTLILYMFLNIWGRIHMEKVAILEFAIWFGP